MAPVLNILKIVWLFFWLIFFTLLLFIPIITAAMLGKTGNTAFSITRLWAMGILAVTGTRTTVRGKENIDKSRSYIIISNHQSHFDILAIVVRLGIQYRWIIKKEIRKVPLFGYALHASRNIFIDRSNRQSAISSINDGVDRLPPGVGVLFFAEGTRSPDGTIREFKKGGFVTAVEKGLPILPVTVNGSRKVLPKHRLVYRSGKIEVVVAKPIETVDCTPETIDALVKKTRDTIIANFDPDYPRRDG